MTEKKRIDPRRSEAAKKGWITRRLKQGIGLTVKQKRSLAAKKGWETRRKKQARVKPERKTDKERELENRIAELEKQLTLQKEELEKQKSYTKRLEKGIENLRIKEYQKQVPPAEEVSFEIAKDPEAAKVAVAGMIQERLDLGWPFFQALHDVWEEMGFVDEFSDIADIREAWEEAGDSSEAEVAA